MSDDRNKDDRESGGRNRDEKPRGADYVAYTVRQREGDKPFWNRIGAGFDHKDGEGIDVVLSSLPVDGRVALRRQREEEFKEGRRDQAEEDSRPRSRDRESRRR
jgi:hypothetical protein